MFMVMKEHVTQCNSVMCFWTTEIDGTVQLKAFQPLATQT